MLFFAFSSFQTMPQNPGRRCALFTPVQTLGGNRSPCPHICQFPFSWIRSRKKIRPMSAVCLFVRYLFALRQGFDFRKTQPGK
jgi:hypothetical protein